jgi:hypothetical protein
MRSILEEEAAHLPDSRPWTSKQPFPPDALVPQDTSPAREAELRVAGEAGSADAEYALGLLFAARGDLAAVRTAWTRAEVLGSAEATFAIGMGLAPGRDPADAQAVKRADERGSMFAAYWVAEWASQQHDAGAAALASERAMRRATAADALGSADAARLLAYMLMVHGAVPEAVAALTRAERRGSIGASADLALALVVAGDLDAAEAAARRGVVAEGTPAASYALAVVLYRRRDRKGYRDAILTAIETASAAGDVETYQLALKRIRPFDRAWVGRHWRLIASVMLTVAVAGFFGGWRWAVTLTATILVIVLTYMPIVPGMPVPTLRAEPESVSLLGVGASAGIAPAENPLQGPPKRRATWIDAAIWKVFFYLTAAWTLSLWPWAAGVWSGNVVLRIGSGLLAVLVVSLAIQQWTQGSKTEPENESGSEQLTVRLSYPYPLIPLFGPSLEFRTNDPAAVQQWKRLRGLKDAQRPGLVARLAGLVPFTAAVVYLMTLALAPDRRAAVQDVWIVVVTVIGVLGIGWGLAKAFNRGLRAARDRNAIGVASAAGFLVLVALLVAITYWTRLAGDFLSTLRRLL